VVRSAPLRIRRASREKTVDVVRGAKVNRAAAVAALSERYVGERAKLKALGLLREKPADNQNALARDSVDSARATPGIAFDGRECGPSPGGVEFLVLSSCY
jgi:hypothetical protein